MTIQFCVNLSPWFVSQVSNEPGNRYNIQLINALVLYVGTQAIAHIHNKGSTPSMSTITHSAHMDIFQNLAVDLDTEGKVATRSPVFCQIADTCRAIQSFLQWVYSKSKIQTTMPFINSLRYI